MTLKNAKAAQLRAGGLRKSDQLAGRISTEDTKTPTELQALRLTRRFAISMPVALLLADLAYRSEVAR